MDSVGFDLKYPVMHQKKVLSLRNHQRSMLGSITRRDSFLVGFDFDKPAKQFQVGTHRSIPATDVLASIFMILLPKYFK